MPSSARYTSLMNGLPRRLPPWNQIQTSQRVMGGMIIGLLLIIMYMGRDRYAPPYHGYAPSDAMRPPYEPYEPPVSGGPARGSVENAIQVAESMYKVVLEERARFITSLGGPSRIKSWPTGALQGAYWTLWDFFLPVFECPHHVERIGRMGDGGKYLCGMDLIAKKNEVVIYSFGVSDDSSYEAALLERVPTAQVYGYDYSVESWGPQIENDASLKSRSHFFKWAVGDTDAHGPDFDPNFQVYTLDTLMQINGHTWIDILKIDIEAAEFGVLRGFCKYYMERGLPLPFGQLQVEIHAWDMAMTFAQFLKWFEELEAAGLRPFRSEPNLVYVNLYGQKPTLSEYAFINLGGRHELVSEML